MNIVTALLKYYRFILSAFFLTIFLFVFIPQSVQALYFRPGTDPFYPNSTLPSCYQPPEEVPMADCIDYGGIQPQNQCFQNPWRFYYAARCIASPIGPGPACDFSYEYEYNNCDTSDRCYGSDTGASGYDSAGRVIPGICSASSYDGVNPNSACVSGGWYKQCCSSGLYYPTTYCSAGICPAGQITSAGTTSCNTAPVTCTEGTTYNQCGGTCNGITYPSNHTIQVTPSTCTDNTTQYACSDLGVLAGQCGNPSTPPPSCSVTWTLSNTNPQSNTPVNVTVDGTSTPDWTGASYSLDGGGWNPAGSGPAFNFSVNSDSSSTPHDLRFAINNGSVVCNGTGSFSTQAATIKM